MARKKKDVAPVKMKRAPSPEFVALLCRLKPGDVIEQPSVLAGLDATEQALLEVLENAELEAAIRQVTFRLSWLGVFLSNVAVTFDPETAEFEWKHEAGGGA